MDARSDAARMFGAQHLSMWRLLIEKWRKGVGLKEGPAALRGKQQDAELSITVITAIG